MLNKYYWWQNTLIILFIIIGIIYSLPNIYRDIPVVQINILNKNFSKEKIIINIKNKLISNKINFTKFFLNKNNNINIIFNNINNQLQAYEILKKNSSKKYIVIVKSISSIPRWLSFLRAKPIKLGLDLKGGIYFLLRVNNNYIFQKLREQNIEDLKLILKNKNILFKLKRSYNFNYKIFFKNNDIRDKTINYLKKQNNNFVNYNVIKNGLLVSMKKQWFVDLKETIIENNINVLRNRVNQIGISDAIVQRKGINNIVIELPGIQNFSEAKEILGSTATLEFHLVNNNINNVQNKNVSYYLWNNKIPILLNKKIIIDGSNIIHSNVSRNEYNQPQVNIFLDKKGGDILSKFSEKHIGDNIATVLVDYINSNKKDIKGNIIQYKKEEIINIATIQSKLNNNFKITGLKNIKEAKKLSILLRSGSLSAPIQIIEEQNIGPSVGQENIKQGIKACIIGILICIIFMIFYYHIFGIIAIIALFINLIFTISFLSLLPGATLTMSGIAGIVLALAIAIDANVLINERIKEELNNKVSIQKAIDFGYKGAFSSIFDANVTTLITSCVLYSLGSREIQGFAITTFIGILTSMFTSIIITRAIVNIIYGGKKIKKLPI
ncbi:protein translocase subunit SecD [Enterobacteriaceae endosymbiont of Plateumaris consimilis]|uniref:protein translocase subunit SecD n=1 Tax=Enterobacteriaceae endosymbiont of Plateumaris consimilis TaxID=2675794 RepID=UPI0014497FAE|nr:protein translocase subunit SecD [Enterobacteriaceae endosymbiont of Plateumaris consimilis]QJC28572.1 protein translocase subunit SecD [Enterobacteriaceae endosymbiont of Plateumaris consimilis]